MSGFISQKYSSLNPDNRTGINLSHGVFEAIVMENKDALMMGRLAVYIPELGGNVSDPQSWKTVRYASPFYGITPYREQELTTQDQQNFNRDRQASSQEVQQMKNQQQNQSIVSYGMWAVPPDLGVTVLVMFAGGDLNRGFWFACVPTVSHGMVPAIGAPDGKTPMAEFNPIDPTVPVTEDLASIKRPPHQPLVQQLSAQGIQADPLRGPITSSSFREAPSNVFGISSKAGHTFVMDDGDQGGKSKLIRLRTANGNQITMHDDTGMIYMINAGGTGWVEISPSGQIDVFGAAGINMASPGDINFHADKNVNIHAGNCVKIVGMKGTKVQGTEELQLHGKKLWIQGVDALHIHACKEMMITSFGDIHMKAFNYFCLKGKCFFWNSCTAKEAEQTPPEKPADVSGYQTTVARAPNHEPYKEHDGGGGASASGSGPASGATSGSMTGNGSSNAGAMIGGTGQVFSFSGSQQQAFDTVYAAAVKAGSPDPRMTASVAMLESGYLGSSMTQRANNPFGQTIVASQIGTNGIVGGTTGADGQLHAVYESVDAAVADHVRRWAPSYVAGNAEQTTANLVGKGYNTVNPLWSRSVNTVYASSNNTNNPVAVNNTPTANTTASVTVPRTTTTASTSVDSIKTSSPGTSVRTDTNTAYYNGGGSGATFNSTSPIKLQNAVKVSAGPTTTTTSSTYTPGTSTNPGKISVTTETNTGGPTTQYTSTTSRTTTIDASSPAANSYLGRGGAAPVGADPALANVNPTDTTGAGASLGSFQSVGEVNGRNNEVQPDPAANEAGSRGDRLPGDPTGSAQSESAAQKASQALDQTAGQAPASDVPAGPGGGNSDCFQKGDNCARPQDGGSPGGIGGAQTGQKNFVPPDSLKNDPEFQKKLAEMKAKYPGLTDQQIYNVIGGESGFNFANVNPDSGATGAFQFLPSTAQGLGYTTGQIQAMSPAQQLAVYDQYLSSNGYKGGSLGIMQAAPAFAGRPGNTIVYPQGSAAWVQNRGWRGPDGQITVDSINRYYGY